MKEVDPVEFGKKYQVSLAFRSVWAKAENVTVVLKPEEKFVSIKQGIRQIKSIEAGEFADIPFTFEISRPSSMPAAADEGMLFSNILAEKGDSVCIERYVLEA